MEDRHGLAIAALMLAICGCGPRMQPRPAPVVLADARVSARREVAVRQPVRSRSALICPDCGGWGARPNQSPALFVVDGRVVPVPPGARLPIDPAQVRHIEILKGAEAIRRFGTAAEHGVVLITTRR